MLIGNKQCRAAFIGLILFSLILSYSMTDTRFWSIYSHGSVEFGADGVSEKNTNGNIVNSKNIPRSDREYKPIENSTNISTMNLINDTALAMIEGTSHPLPQDVNIILRDPTVCANDRLLYIIYVHSSPKNVERRANLRSTWGNKKLFRDGRTNIVFLMGINPDNQSQAIIQREFAVYHDIVQGDFIDSYRNITLKGLMGLKWVSKYCSNAQYVIKADDDAFVNIFEIVKLLSKGKQYQKSLACYVNVGIGIGRKPHPCSKWCIDADEFPGWKSYPKYCMGFVYIMSRDIVPALYNASFSTPFFWVDDVYITGLLPRKVKDVQYIHMKRKLGYTEDMLNDYLNRTQPLPYLISHISTRKYVHLLWAALLQRLTPLETKIINDEIVAGSLKQIST